MGRDRSGSGAELIEEDQPIAILEHSLDLGLCNHGLFMYFFLLGCHKLLPPHDLLLLYAMNPVNFAEDVGRDLGLRETSMEQSTSCLQGVARPLSQSVRINEEVDLFLAELSSDLADVLFHPGLVPGYDFVDILSVHQLLFVLPAHRSNIGVTPVDQFGYLGVRLPAIAQVGVMSVAVSQYGDKLLELLRIVLHG